MELETTLPGWFARTGAPAIDPAAIDPAKLVADHQQMVYQIAYSVLRNPADAADASQDAFLKLFRGAEKLAEVTDKKSWIARIAWNAALDAKRRLRHAAAHAPVEDLARGVAELRDAGRSPEEIAAGSHMKRLLEQLIETLPGNLREVLQLATVQELEYREIADALGVTEAAVRSRLFQARQRLKEKLEHLLGETS